MSIGFGNRKSLFRVVSGCLGFVRSTVPFACLGFVYGFWSCRFFCHTVRVDLSRSLSISFRGYVFVSDRY